MMSSSLSAAPDTSGQAEPAPAGSSLREVAAVFLRLGCTAFGGPAAHIAMMRHELVQRRRWVSDERFMDLLGATNLIPGPNSTEMAIHLGFIRAGWAGLVVAGALFIGPAMLMVLAFAWAYVTYGSLPQAQWLLYGVKPVIIAIVVQALYSLARTALKGPVLIVVAAGVLALYLAGVNELVLLFGGGAAGLLAQVLVRRARAVTAPRLHAAMPTVPVVPAMPAGALGAGGTLKLAASVAVAAAAVPFSLATLFLTFLKIGAVLYGSGYVLLAFLRGDFVERLGWLTDRQLLDAISVGQFTPGPVFTTATFVGYVAGSGGGMAHGVVAALVATAGIFLPSFVFVALSGPIVPHLRRWPLVGLLLDGVNAAALGLMAAVTLTLGQAAIVDPFTVVLALASLAVLLRWKPNSAWLVLAGAVAGLLAHVVAPAAL